ncbi:MULTISPECIES: sensor histidine kinase [Nocardioides]|uniref:sensor histidine kinase n=1 Tax=Nocardioides TaxID=1839 RepID=UPI00032D8F41|nr:MULTISPECIES: histidine kinase [Nocardioides]EON23345.1 ATPase domain-containing protein [Nocardioides sp. CF8]
MRNQVRPDPLTGIPVSARSARASAAIRTFTLSLAAGLLLSTADATRALPVLLALGVIAVACSTLELGVLTRGGSWLPVTEALLSALVLTSAPPEAALLVYLAAPPVIAGLRHGAVACFNVTLVGAIAVIATAILSEGRTDVARILESVPWLVMGLGVGQLAGWQSRSVRDLEARQAPFAAAHQLMSQLHDLTSAGAVGLDSVQLAAELEAALRRTTGASRSAVLLHGRQDEVDLISSYGDLKPPPDVDGEVDPSIASICLAVADNTFGSVVLVREAGWTLELLAMAQEVAEEFVLRLDTAVTFDEVRLMATSEERTRIAREMHDGVAQEIVALGYVVDEIESMTSESSVQSLAASLRDEISRVVADLRFSIFDLRHHVADHQLAGALAEYVREVSHGTDLRVHLVLDESGPPLPRRTEVELLRVAQEAIGNVRRHAEATNLWVTLVCDGASIRLEIEDDGVGNAVPREKHWGLQTMRERAQCIGAELTISPRTEGGTVVLLQTKHHVATEGMTRHEHHSSPRR